jgi:hypothetical protein
MIRLIATIVLMASMCVLAGDKLYSRDGQYLGKVSNNKFDSESISNPYGKYGSKYSSTSINNNYSKYGSDYSTQSRDLRMVSDNGQVKKVEKKDVYKMLDLD